MQITSSPHIHSRNNIGKIMWNVVIALLPTTIAGIYFFGTPALIIIVTSVFSAILTEAVSQKLMKKELTIKDGSAVVTGLLLALVLPPTVPVWIPIIGAIFAIAIVKHAFGGLGHNIFNPALAARAFLVAAWPMAMSTFSFDGVTTATPLATLKHGIKASYFEMFIGNIPGAIGETSALALIIGGIYLIFNKIIDLHIPLGYIATVFILTLFADPLYHLLAGGLLLGAFFMATDYVTTPITKQGKLIFGIGCGILTVIIRVYSKLPEGVMYSILVMNALTPLIELVTKPKPFGYKK